MKKILLTRGRVALVDDADYDCVRQFSWQALPRINGNYYAARRALKSENLPVKIVLMHSYLIGKKQGHEIDHLDGNGLNNQRANLEHVTHRQNMQNLHSKRTSKYPGVGWHKKTSKWRAYIEINGRLKHLGMFMSEAEAFSAYQKALAGIGETIYQAARMGDISQRGRGR